MQQAVPQAEPFEQQGELFRALGVESSLLPVELYRNGPPHVYVRLSSPEAVAALAPDMAALKELDVAVNCFAGHGGVWKTRMFYPAAAIPEDPATGSAAGPLAVHLVRHGEILYGDEIEIHQGDEVGRPSLLYAVVGGEGERVDSVEVGGAAVIVAEGRMRLARGG
jgi:trans-2,3-dihydro-3-hydroxyanthranilate isomerase